MEKYKILIKPSAVKELEAIPQKKIRQQIIRRIQSLATNPFPPGASKLTGNDRFRLRQGAYRIIYTVLKMQLTINIIKVGHRRDIYRNQ